MKTHWFYDLFHPNSLLLQKKISWYYHFFARSYDHLMIQHDLDFRRSLFRNLPISSGDLVLEAGIGTGMNIPYYPAHACYVGLDASEAMLNFAKRKKEAYPDHMITLLQGYADRIPYPRNHFNSALCTYVLSATPYHNYILSELERVVKPQGYVGIVDFSNVHGSSQSGYDGTVSLDLFATLERHPSLHLEIEQRRINPHRGDEMQEQALLILRVEK